MVTTPDWKRPCPSATRAADGGAQECLSRVAQRGAHADRPPDTAGRRLDCPDAICD
jgi:hypothetical protein